MGFHRRVQVGEGADGARNGAGGDLGAGRNEPRPAARKLGVMACQFQPEGGWLGMDGVAAPDADRVLELHGAAFEGRQQAVHAGEQDIG